MRPEDAVAGWIKSPPHCANLMNGAFTENQLLPKCGPEWTAVDRIIFSGGTKRGDQSVQAGIVLTSSLAGTKIH